MLPHTRSSCSYIYKKLECNYDLFVGVYTPFFQRFSVRVLMRCPGLLTKLFFRDYFRVLDTNVLMISLIFKRLTSTIVDVPHRRPPNFILYIYSTNIGTEYFKHGIYSPSFSLQNAVCFIILTNLVPVLFTFYIQDVL